MKIIGKRKPHLQEIDRVSLYLKNMRDAEGNFIPVTDDELKYIVQAIDAGTCVFKLADTKVELFHITQFALSAEVNSILQKNQTFRLSHYMYFIYQDFVLPVELVSDQHGNVHKDFFINPQLYVDRLLAGKKIELFRK
jgi:hypothetical protein